MDSILKSFLVLWFSTGLLEIQRVDWNSPAEIVEKVAHYESVHQIRTLNDLKNRLSSSRRCFIYTHSTMPNEPLVILHIALTNSISSNIRSFIHSTQRPNENKDIDPNYTNAIFYSINSCQKGLQQVDLGNALIKSCVQLLIKEMPSLKYFHTLSPIPNFKEWLDLRLNMAISKSKSDSVSTISKQPDEYFNLRRFFKQSELDFLGNYFNLNSQEDFSFILSRLKIYINSAKFRGDVQAVDLHGNKLACYDNEILNTTLINFLKRACAFYLYHEKKNGYAFNSVCNFHIKNGAQIYRLNFGGDTTEKGWKTSYSLMVNYGYYLEDLDSNCISYLTNKTIKVSDLFNEVVKEIN
jgi:malonyl-CoA decarboxylase